MPNEDLELVRVSQLSKNDAKSNFSDAATCYSGGSGYLNEDRRFSFKIHLMMTGHTVLIRLHAIINERIDPEEDRPNQERNSISAEIDSTQSLGNARMALLDLHN